MVTGKLLHVSCNALHVLSTLYWRCTNLSVFSAAWPMLLQLVTGVRSDLDKICAVSQHGQYKKLQKHNSAFTVLRALARNRNSKKVPFTHVFGARCYRIMVYSAHSFPAFLFLNIYEIKVECFSLRTIYPQIPKTLFYSTLHLLSRKPSSGI